MKRTALILVYYASDNEDPERVKVWKIPQTQTREFLIGRDRRNKRPGFLEISLRPHESVQSAVHRYNRWSDQAIKQPWQELITFGYEGREIIVGHLGVGRAQRQADLYEQTGEQTRELPVILGWETSGWLLQQAEEGFLNKLSGIALSKGPVQEFVRHSVRVPRAA